MSFTTYRDRRDWRQVLLIDHPDFRLVAAGYVKLLRAANDCEVIGGRSQGRAA